MAIILGRRVVAAYAASISLRNTTAFSAYPSIAPRAKVIGHTLRSPPPAVLTQEPTPITSVAMSASTSPADADTKVDIASNVASVRQRIEDALSSNDRPAGSARLVAVSKTKPLELLQAAYETGQRYFGENYAQELMTKAKDMPDDVSWHFIGPLQSNKAAPLVKTVGLDRLACIETVSTLKLATKLNRAVETLNEDVEEKKKLGIYIQVNTSGEESKSGVTPDGEVADLVKQISEECPSLSINGLMTIGAPGDFSCFDTLAQCRDEVSRILNLDPSDLELSMGMSGDFEVAIAKGATSVRVGSTIFGERDYSNIKK